MKPNRMLLLGLGALLLSLSAIYALLDFSIQPYFENDKVHTNETLTCVWRTNENSMANISWYRNGVFNRKISKSCASGADCTSSIPNGDITRYDSWNCSVLLYNSTGYKTTRSATLQILNANPQFINLDTYYKLYEDALFEHDVNCLDPDEPGTIDGDGTAYTHQCKSGCPFFASNLITASGQISIIPLLANVGNHTVQIIAIDDEPEYGTNKKEVRFEVIPVNDVPDINGTSKVKINEGSKLRYRISATDEESTLLTDFFPLYVNTSYVRDLPYLSEQINFTRTGTRDATIHFFSDRSSNFNDRGNHTITVKVCDPVNASLCRSRSIILEVVPVNQAPVLQFIPTQVGIQNQRFFLKVNATDVDVMDRLNFTIAALGCPISNPWSIITTNWSANASAEINVTLTNNHVACRNLTITVRDSVLQADSQNVFFNITNVNDVPLIINDSRYSNNTHGNRYLNRLKAYTGLPFSYRVNATDIDMITYEGDTINFWTNASQCNPVNCPNFIINRTTGVMNFTPNVYYGNQNFTFLLIVNDTHGAKSNYTIFLSIVQNTPPYFVNRISHYEAYEGQRFELKVNGSDADGNFDSYSDTSSFITINRQTGLINITPSCSDIGLHIVGISINDTFGATNYTEANIDIHNVNDAPFIQAIPRQTAVEGIRYELDITNYRSDEDLTCGPGDTFTYSDDTTLFDIHPVLGTISFTPIGSQIGSHIVNITVTDFGGLSYKRSMNLTILASNNPPIMHNVTAAYTGDLVNWYSKSLFPGNKTTISVDEGTIVRFNHTTTDPDGDPLVYYWYNGSNALLGRSRALIYNFSWGMQGGRNVTLHVFENRSGVLANSVSFMWNVSILNINRPPYLDNPIPNQTINIKLKKTDFLTGLDENEKRFVDPDGDPLTFRVSPTFTHCRITIEGPNVTFEPLSLGVDYVIFNATDGQYTNFSNNVTINVSYVPDNNNNQDVVTRTKTKTKTVTTTIPIVQTVKEEVEKEKDSKLFFELIVPKEITIYANNTVIAPLTLINNENVTLHGIKLTAVSNITSLSDDVNMRFKEDYFKALEPGQKTNTELIIDSYKTFSKYEVYIYANITEPKYADRAVIYINSIEKTKGNQSVTNTKITFAHDLLSNNKECLELNGFLLRAETMIQQKDYEEAEKIIDSVVQGCKYLMTKSGLNVEQPTGSAIRVDLSKLSLSDPAVIVIGSVAAILTVFSAVALIATIKK